MEAFLPSYDSTTSSLLPNPYHLNVLSIPHAFLKLSDGR
jgi:hypothetical protein